MRLKARDHCVLRSLIRQIGKDHPSSFTLEGKGLLTQRLYHG